MIERKIRNFIKKHSLIPVAARVLVAYSGGPDSTCLLMILRKFFPDTAAVYVNHQMRGQESQREEEFVREFCDHRKIPLFVERIEWKKMPSNFEEAARKRRYRHFAKVASQHRYEKVALAHHREDVVETFLLRLIRGSGPRGLAQMKAQRDSFIRPMLELERREILQYLKKNRIPYFSDTSNKNLKFARNRIRNELIPYITKHLNSAFPQTIQRTAQWLEEQNEILTELLQPYLLLLQTTKEGWALDRKKFLELNPVLQKAVLVKYLERMDRNLGVTARAIQALQVAIQTGNDFELPGFLRLRKGFQFVRKDIRTGLVEIDVPGPGDYSYPAGDLILSFRRCDSKTFSSKANIALLDAEKASFPLYIRNWKSGDSFRPLGMKGSQKLSDFFINKKVPRNDRKKIPLVFKDDDLIWVAGHQIHQDYRITDATNHVLKIELK